jgi:hypothetical protein
MRNIADCGFYRCAFRALHSHILKSASVECGKRSGTVIPHSALPIPHWEVESNHLPKNNCSLFYFLFASRAGFALRKTAHLGTKKPRAEFWFSNRPLRPFLSSADQSTESAPTGQWIFSVFFDLKKNEGNLKADPPGRKRFFNYF